MRQILLKTSMLILLLCLTQFAEAQNYKTGVGLRAGWSNGLTVKHFMKQGVAIEGILTTRWRGFLVTGLFEKHGRLKVNELQWFVGLGGHIGFWNEGWRKGSKNHPWFDNDKDTYTAIGLDAIIGLEYAFKEIPFSLSLDWKPVINLSGGNGFWGDEAAISIRYTF